MAMKIAVIVVALAFGLCTVADNEMTQDVDKDERFFWFPFLIRPPAPAPVAGAVPVSRPATDYCGGSLCKFCFTNINVEKCCWSQSCYGKCCDEHYKLGMYAPPTTAATTTTTATTTTPTTTTPTTTTPTTTTPTTTTPTTTTPTTTTPTTTTPTTTTPTTTTPPTP